jgi:hypothetical protein
MHSSSLSTTIYICIFSYLFTCASSQGCSNQNAPGCTSTQQFSSGTCEPSQCQSGCCVNNTCAQTSKDCKISVQSFIFVAAPFVFVFLLLTVTLCVSIIKKSRQNRANRDVLPVTELNPGVMQGEIVNVPYKKTRGGLSTKIIPINIVEIQSSTPAPSTMASPNSNIIEISPEEFEKQMVKDVEKILQKQEKMMKVPRGVQVIIFRRNSVMVPQAQSECEERVLTA